MLAALEGGSYVLASVDARALMEQRETAVAAGFALTGLDAAVDGAARAASSSTSHRRVGGVLSTILGDLYPTLTERRRAGGGRTSPVQRGARTPETRTSNATPTERGAGDVAERRSRRPTDRRPRPDPAPDPTRRPDPPGARTATRRRSSRGDRAIVPRAGGRAGRGNGGPTERRSAATTAASRRGRDARPALGRVRA